MGRGLQQGQKKCYSVKGGSTLKISNPKEYDLKDGNIEDGYINFAVLIFSFTSLEFLHLKSSGHRRVIHTWDEILFHLGLFLKY